MIKTKFDALIKSFKNIGPGPIIAAAFIGPGTVTLCTITGAYFGYALLWAIALSVLVAMFMQEMAVRIGILSQKSITEVIRQEINNPILKGFIVVLIFLAILIGNTAYEAGNISGGVLGMEAITGKLNWTIGNIAINPLSLIMGGIGFALLYIGSYKVIERILIVLVVTMSLSFFITTIMAKPDFSEIAKGLFGFGMPEDSLLTIIGLVGTTIVPYNLFLHASLVQQKWKKKSDLKIAVKDMVIAISIGGLTSMCIIITAAAADIQNIANAADLAKGLEPLFGSNAKYILGIGLFSAGISSAITAPLGAAYVTCGCFGWEANLKSKKFRLIWAVVLLLGVFFSSLNIKLITVIQFAQITNGILLPVIACILVWLMNRPSVLGDKKNSKIQNFFGIVIIVITSFLGIKSILSVFNLV